MCISGQKHVNSVKTILYYGPKKSMPFFKFPYEKITTLMRIFVKKSTFPNENTLFMPIFCEKTSILSKTLYSHVKFFNFFMNNSMLPCLYLVKKIINSVKAPLHYWPKSQQDALFSKFSRKNNCSHAHILSKNVHSLKNTMLSLPSLVKKTSILSKT